MKTLTRLLRLVLATTAIGTLASFAADEPGVERWGPGRSITSFSDAKKTAPGDLVTLQCKDCAGKVTIKANHDGTTDKSRAAWYAVGAKRRCTDCEGTITAAQGENDETLRFDCSKCGEGAVACHAAKTE